MLSVGTFELEGVKPRTVDARASFLLSEWRGTIARHLLCRPRREVCVAGRAQSPEAQISRPRGPSVLIRSKPTSQTRFLPEVRFIATDGRSQTTPLLPSSLHESAQPHRTYSRKTHERVRDR